MARVLTHTLVLTKNHQMSQALKTFIKKQWLLGVLGTSISLVLETRSRGRGTGASISSSKNCVVFTGCIKKLMKSYPIKERKYFFIFSFFSYSWLLSFLDSTEAFLAFVLKPVLRELFSVAYGMFWCGRLCPQKSPSLLSSHVCWVEFVRLLVFLSESDTS